MSIKKKDKICYHKVNFDRKNAEFFSLVKKNTKNCKKQLQKKAIFSKIKKSARKWACSSAG